MSSPISVVHPPAVDPAAPRWQVPTPGRSARPQRGSTFTPCEGCPHWEPMLDTPEVVWVDYSVWQELGEIAHSQASMITNLNARIEPAPLRDYAPVVPPAVAQTISFSGSECAHHSFEEDEMPLLALCDGIPSGVFLQARSWQSYVERLDDQEHLVAVLADRLDPEPVAPFSSYISKRARRNVSSID